MCTLTEHVSDALEISLFMYLFLTKTTHFKLFYFI